MKRLSLALSATFLALVLAAPAARAGSVAIVDQSGSYNLTIVQQKAGQTKVVTKEIKPRLYASTANRLATKTAKAGIKQSLLGGFRAMSACGAGHGGNSVSVDQYGVGNHATAVQAGSGNAVIASQTGSDNAAFVVQQGSNHTAYTTQAGNNNIAFVNQRC